MASSAATPRLGQFKSSTARMSCEEMVIEATELGFYSCFITHKIHGAGIYGPVLRLSTPPHGLGPQVAAPIPSYLQAIGSISEVQLRIC